MYYRYDMAVGTKWVGEIRERDKGNREAGQSRRSLPFHKRLGAGRGNNS